MCNDEMFLINLIEFLQILLSKMASYMAKTSSDTICLISQQITFLKRKIFFSVQSLFI